ncbi:MAG: hypothetical protein JSR67_13920 [Proteobacteria bacterium]|nr:hypothetical protein [Pseudomonadota bacterium]
MSVIAEKLTYRLSGKAALPLLFIVPMFLVSFTPRVLASPKLVLSFWGATAALTLWYVFILIRAVARGEELSFDVQIVRTHYVQGLVQGSIYLYWAQYWPFIEGQTFLILAQLLFAYAFSLLLAWAGAQRWRLGFGPLPIILSTNLFMCFKDDWFYLQFGMVALGLLGKELFRWRRDGRVTHIFNPSALSLFLVSLVLIFTGTTDFTWAEPIAIRLGLPDHIYLWIFAVGLIVQALFRVTLVTLAAAAALYLLNVIYLTITGVYWFMDAGIPIAVFLGLHLIVTDPATSPRTNFGRFIFGALYGAGVFFAYALLEWGGVPRFYDKLLCVPLLNLGVQLMDRFAARSSLARLPPFARIGRLSPNAQNLLFMGLWTMLFVWMSATDFIGKDHAGLHPDTWERACSQGLRNGCRNWAAIYHDDCAAGSPSACMQYVSIGTDHPAVHKDPLWQVRAYARACDLADVRGCAALQPLLSDDVARQLDSGCSAGEGKNCYILGMVNLLGLKSRSDPAVAFRYFRRSCALGVPTGCSVTGDAYRFGVGTRKDSAQAAHSYDRACSRTFLPSCVTLAQMLLRGDGIPEDRRRGRALLAETCLQGSAAACAARADFMPIAAY